MREDSQRPRRDSARTDLAISVAFHSVIAFFLFFWAAHEGVLGARLKELTVAIVPKEKPPEPPPPPPVIEPPRAEELQPSAPVPALAVTAPPPVAAVPQNSGGSPAPVAPAPNAPADFVFSEGAKPVATSTNAAVAYYKTLVEYSLRSHWERPAQMVDEDFTAEVEVLVDGQGKLTSYNWKKGSGNQRWDDSVRQALATTKTITRPPPKDFPGRFLVRFDVIPASEPILP